MRRSVANQIEHGATLGPIVEHAGLSVQETRAAIGQYEASPPHQQAAAPNSVNVLSARLRAAQGNSSLARRERHVVRENQQRIG